MGLLQPKHLERCLIWISLAQGRAISLTVKMCGYKCIIQVFSRWVAQLAIGVLPEQLPQVTNGRITIGLGVVAGQVYQCQLKQRLGFDIGRHTAVAQG
jgi:hypothetical protein